MRLGPYGLSSTLVFAFLVSGFVNATPASADCTGNGPATVCAQGDVRGNGGPTPPKAGYYPSYCADPWYCDNGWDVDIVIPRPPLRPGGGGGIGPRR